MVTLSGLGCKSGGWKAAAGIWEASEGYLEAPGGQGSGLRGQQTQSIRPGEGKIFIQGPYSNIETLAVSVETVLLVFQWLESADPEHTPRGRENLHPGAL